MKRSFVNLSTDFLFPKLHGMWAELLRGEALRRTIQSGRTDAVGRALAALGIDVTHRAGVQRALTAYLIGELAEIRRLLDRRTGAYYTAFVDRFFFENLKTVLHYHHFPEHDVPIDFLLVDSPDLPAFDVDGVRRARNTNQLYREIPDHEIRPVLLPLLVELEDTKDIFAAECRLDRMYYQSLLAHAGKLPRATRRYGLALTRREIDVRNLEMLLRNHELYELPDEQIRELAIPGGEALDPERVPQVADDSRRTLVAALPKELQDTLEPLADAELYLVENALWNQLYRMAVEAFTDYNRPAGAVAVFPLIKYVEILNLGRVFEGLHFGLAPAAIQSMMIGL